MNEVVRRALVRFAILLAACALSAWAGYAGRSGEVGTAESHLRDAVEAGRILGERLDRSEERVTELEGIAADRQRTIRELEADLQFAIERARERDRLIAELEGRFNSLSSRGRAIGNLASEGREIVTSMLD